ncbi:uncharacterized protein LOC126632503 [Malus sylvestris]|uniref:uncharacterized protein LOC126632503 n=1 Tax=Malus sylvestris TaxID=3752 RepID=UPI0021ABC3DA|nr:uncharacterized protein LOC126632503 [Malus sylvestris]
MGKRSSQRKNAAMMDFGICVSSTSTTRSFRNEDMQVEKDSLLDQAVDALNEKSYTLLLIIILCNDSNNTQKKVRRSSFYCCPFCLLNVILCVFGVHQVCHFIASVSELHQQGFVQRDMFGVSCDRTIGFDCWMWRQCS